jgi:uncharacterized LabA/DUF88 family protein
MKGAVLFVDEANLYLAARKNGWGIDWVRFLQYARHQYGVVQAFLYEGIPTARSLRASNPGIPEGDVDRIRRKKHQHFRQLRTAGYTVRHKPVSTIDSMNKCNFDVELAIDAVDQCASCDVCVIASGDGDFVRLVRFLRGKGKEVHIIGPKRSSKNLRKEARGNFKSLDGIRSYVQKEQARL